jgi:hypothetical protein
MALKNTSSMDAYIIQKVARKVAHGTKKLPKWRKLAQSGQPAANLQNNPLAQLSKNTTIHLHN